MNPCMDLKLPKPQVYEMSASLMKRLLSLVVDLYIVFIVVVSPFSSLFPKEVKFSSGLVLLVFSISLLALCYFSFSELWAGQTIGMKLMGLHIVADTKFTLLKSILRNIFALPFFPFILLWVIEPLALLFGGKRIMERITGTRTVEFITMQGSELV